MYTITPIYLMESVTVFLYIFFIIYIIIFLNKYKHMLARSDPERKRRLYGRSVNEANGITCPSRLTLRKGPESRRLLDNVAIYHFIQARTHSRMGTCSSGGFGPYSLRGILAEQVGMNGEVERPQRGGHLSGAQGPHRVPPAKAIRKSRQFFPGGNRRPRKDVHFER